MNNFGSPNAPLDWLFGSFSAGEKCWEKVKDGVKVVKEE